MERVKEGKRKSNNRENGNTEDKSRLGETIERSRLSFHLLCSFYKLFLCVSAASGHN